MTYEQFCADYKPGPYSHRVSTPGVAHDAELLQRILACALWRADHELLKED